MSKPCAVFDLDDTLYLERDYVRSGFEHVGRYADENLGTRDFAGRAWQLFSRGVRNSIFNGVLEEQNVACEPQTIANLVSLYRGHTPRIQLLPDALRCLNTLRGDVPLVLITDGPIESQRNKIAALQLEQWFIWVIVTEELGKDYRKPSVLAFRLVQEKDEFKDRHFCYVADNPAKDFAGPRKLGWRTIRVRREDGLHSAVETDADNAADVEVSELREVPDILQRTSELEYRGG
jgi:putative hydrolase of the HAD superfamily